MTRALGVILMLATAAWLGACASGGGNAAPAQSSSTAASPAPAQKAAPAKQQAQPPASPAKSEMPAGYAKAPASSKLSKITVGMNDTQVRAILGEPSNANAYMTGKAFIPMYYGTDTARTDWMYTGQGRIVFSRNQYSGGLKVIKVMHNPSEP